jgi:hypothetical protein
VEMMVTFLTTSWILSDQAVSFFYSSKILLFRNLAESLHENLSLCFW